MRKIIYVPTRKNLKTIQQDQLLYPVFSKSVTNCWPPHNLEHVTTNRSKTIRLEILKRESPLSYAIWLASKQGTRDKAGRERGAAPHGQLVTPRIIGAITIH